MAVKNKKNVKQNDQGDDIFSVSDDAAMMDILGDSEESASPRKGNQGFASMSKEKQREIASKGGKAAHQAGTAHEWDSQEAAAAGRRGGQKRAA